MKLSEVDPSQYVKALIYGDSGTGKTCFAAKFPTPTLYLDFDGKVGSAASYYKGEAFLDDITVIDLRPKLDKDCIQEFLNVIRDLEAQIQKGDMPYKTLVVDSITTFSAACLKHIVKTNPATKRVMSKQGVQPGMQDYGILKREFARLIPGLLSLDMNVVMLGHISVTKDELTGELHRSTTMDGSFAQELPIYFEEVYRSYVKDGKHLAQTSSDSRFKCRTQRKVPNPMPLSYDAIIGAL